MEAAIIIIIVAVALLLVAKRFKNLVRNDFYLEKPDMGAQAHCELDDLLDMEYEERRNRIAVINKGRFLGYIPEDYHNIVLRKLKAEPEAKGKLVGMNRSGYKIYIEMKGEVRDIVK